MRPDQGPRFCAHGVLMVYEELGGWRPSRNCMECLGEKLEAERRFFESLDADRRARES